MIGDAFKELNTGQKPSATAAPVRGSGIAAAFAGLDAGGGTEWGETGKSCGFRKCGTYVRTLLQSKGWSGHGIYDVRDSKYATRIDKPSVNDLKPGMVVWLNRDPKKSATEKRDPKNYTDGDHWALVMRGSDGKLYLNEQRSDDKTKKVTISTSRPVSDVANHLGIAFVPKLTGKPTAAKAPPAPAPKSTTIKSGPSPDKWPWGAVPPDKPAKAAAKPASKPAKPAAKPTTPVMGSVPALVSGAQKALQLASKGVSYPLGKISEAGGALAVEALRGSQYPIGTWSTTPPQFGDQQTGVPQTRAEEIAASVGQTVAPLGVLALPGGGPALLGAIGIQGLAQNPETGKLGAQEFVEHRAHAWGTKEGLLDPMDIAAKALDVGGLLIGGLHARNMARQRRLGGTKLPTSDYAMEPVQRARGTTSEVNAATTALDPNWNLNQNPTNILGGAEPATPFGPVGSKLPVAEKAAAKTTSKTAAKKAVEPDVAVAEPVTMSFDDYHANLEKTVGQTLSKRQTRPKYNAAVKSGKIKQPEVAEVAAVEAKPTEPAPATPATKPTTKPRTIDDVRKELRLSRSDMKSPENVLAVAQEAGVRIEEVLAYIELDALHAGKKGNILGSKKGSIRTDLEVNPAIAAYVKLGAARLKRGVKDFNDWAYFMKTQAASFGDDIDPHLRNIWLQVNKAAGTAETPVPKPTATEAASAGPRAPEPPKATTAQAGGEVPKDAWFGTKNASTEVERAMAGLPSVEKPAVQSMQDIYNRGRQAVEVGAVDPRSLADSVSNKPRVLTAQEVTALGYDGVTIKNKLTQLRGEQDALLKAGKNTDAIQAQIADMTTALDKCTEALQIGGREQAVAFNIRKLLLANDYSLETVLQRQRAKVWAEKQTGPSKKEVADLTAEHAKLLDLEAEREALLTTRKTATKATKPTDPGYGATNRFVTRERAEQLREALRQHFGGQGGFLGRGGPKGGAKLPSAKAIPELAELVAYHLEAFPKWTYNQLRNYLRSEIPGLDDGSLSKAWGMATRDKRLAAAKTRRLATSAELEQGMAEGAPVKARPPKVEPDEELLRLDARIRMQRAALDEMTTARPPKSLWDHITEVANVPRTLKTMGEAGHMFRQGAKLAARHPKEWARASIQSIDLLFRDKNLGYIQELRKSHKAYEFAKACKLWEATTDYVTNVSMKEEAFAGVGPLKKVPGVRNIATASERSFYEFGNTLRFDVFYKFYERYGDTVSPESYKALADFLNRATGRGNLMGLEASARTVASVFFAPRWWASQFQTPLYMFSKHAMVRRAAAEAMAGYIGMNLAFLALLKGAGAEVQLNPLSTDFGRGKLGNTRFDLWSGAQSHIRNVAQFLWGQTIKQGATKPTKADREQIALRYIRSKVSPPVGAMWSMAKGKNFVGEDYTPANWKQILFDETAPLFLADVYDAWENEGIGRAAMVMPLVFTGVGVQTWETKPKSQSAAPKSPPTPKAPKLPSRPR